MTSLELLEKPGSTNVLLTESALPEGWTPVSVVLPDDLSEEEVDTLLVRLLTVGRGHQWWIGDTLNYRNARFGQKYTFAMLQTGFGKGYLANMASVANRFLPSRRREVLPWSYHADVAALTDEEQNRWLDACEAENWSRKELRKQLKAAYAGYDPDTQPLEFVSDEGDAETPGEESAAPIETGSVPSGDLHAYHREGGEPLHVDGETMAFLKATLSETLIPLGQCAAPFQIGEAWWILLTLGHLQTTEYREDFGLAQRVIAIDKFQGEAYSLSAWQSRVAEGRQDKGDYTGLVVRTQRGSAWVLVNARMQIFHRSPLAAVTTTDTPAQTYLSDTGEVVVPTTSPVSVSNEKAHEEEQNHVEEEQEGQSEETGAAASPAPLSAGTVPAPVGAVSPAPLTVTDRRAAREPETRNTQAEDDTHEEEGQAAPATESNLPVLASTTPPPAPSPGPMVMAMLPRDELDWLQSQGLTVAVAIASLRELRAQTAPATPAVPLTPGYHPPLSAYVLSPKAQAALTLLTERANKSGEFRTQFDQLETILITRANLIEDAEWDTANPNPTETLKGTQDQ